MKKFLLFLSLTFCLTTNAQIITGFAGNAYGASTGGNAGFYGEGNGAYGGDGGQATNAELWQPTAIAFDNIGNMYIAEVVNNVIRKVSTNGIISTFAGLHGLDSAFNSDGGFATAASLNTPMGVAADAAGNVYIAEGDAVRKVNTNGIISTFAGNYYGQQCNPCGFGGPATNASLNNPQGLTFDAAGNLYICDSRNYCVRKVNTNGIITTVAGGGTVTTDGGQATAANIGLVTGVKVDAVGNMYIANGGNVRKVDASGIITTIAGNGTAGFSGDGGQATAAEIGTSYDIILDKAGNLYISDIGYNSIRKIYPNGIITTIAGNENIAGAFTGNNGPATAARFDEPAGLAFDAADNLYVADVYNNQIRKISSPCNLLFSGVSSICLGNSTVITANGANSYSWSANAGSATTNTVSVSPTSNTIYTVTGVNGNCTATQTVALTVNTVPTLSLTTNTYTICNVGTKTFAASGASTYTWVADPTLSNTNIANPTASPTTTTIYTVTGGNVCGTSTAITVTVAVNPVPTLSLTSNTYTICNGTSQTFTASGANTYTWTPATTLTNANTANPTASPTTSTTYTVSGTTGSCISAPVTTTVTVIASPTLSLTNNSYTICNGNQQVLSVSGASTYTWSSNAGSVTTNTVAVSPTVTSTYSVTGTAGTCTATATTTVSVLNSVPTLSVTSHSYTICNGSSRPLSSSGGGSTYTWSPASSLSNANIASPTASPTTTTVYTVTASNACGLSAPVTVTVTVKSSPVINSQSGSVHVCDSTNASFSVNSTGTNTYKWYWSGVSNGDTTDNADIGLYSEINYTTNTMSIVPITYNGWGSSGAFQIQCLIKGSNGCGILSNPDTIFINPLPTVSVTASSHTVCSGSSTTFTAGGASSYTWTPAATLTNAHTANPTASPTTTTIYTVSGTNTTGCISPPVTVTVTVIASPTLNVTSNSYTICNGSSQTFTTSGASTYTWTPAATLTNANTANPTASPTTTTVYTVTGTSGACTSVATTTVTVINVPTLSLTTNMYPMCNGSSTTFTVSGASTYTWVADPTLSNTNIANPTASPTTTTIYTVTGGNVCGTSTAITVTVAVNPVPTLSLANNFYTICNTSSQALSVSGASTYTWVADPTLSNTNTANPTASPTTTTVYSVTGTSAFGCSNLTAVTVTVNPVSTPTVIVNSAAICLGTSTTLTASGATSYTWSSNAGSANTNTVSVSPSTLTIYTVTTAIGSCTAVATPTVTVIASPTLNVTNSSYTICNGSQQTFSVSGAITYTWTPAATLTNANTANPTASPTSLTVYTVTGTAGTCVSNPATVTVDVKPLPGETGEVISPASCGLSNGTIVGATGTGGSTYSYQWNNTGGFVSSSSFTSVSGTYLLQIKDNVTGCIYSQNFTIPSAGAPAAPSVTASSTNVCASGAVTFSVPVIAGTTYNWTDANANTGTGNTYTISNIPSSPNPYSISVTANNAGCVSMPTTVTITINPSPTATYTLTQDAAPHTWDVYPVFTGGSLPYTYSWSWGDGSPNDITQYPSHTYSVAGSYSICVTVTDANGCASTYCQNDAVSRLGNNSAQSSMVYVNVVDGTTAIPTFNTKNSTVKIYPNPAQNNFTIETNASEKQTINVFDVNGKLVLTQTINGKTNVDASILNPGVYNVNINGTANKRLVIVK